MKSLSGKLCFVVQWNSRKDSVDKCASMLNGFLTAALEITPLFFAWSELKSSMKQSLKSQPVDLMSLDATRKLLLNGQNREDFAPHNVIEELGFGALMWNRDSGGASVTLDVHCGSYVADKYNTVKLDMDVIQNQIPTVEIILRTLETMLENFEANLGVVRFENLNSSGEHVEMDLAFYLVSSSQYNRYWKKSGEFLRRFREGDLLVNHQTLANLGIK
jgi:outer membrane translocation and assembly module TamA